MGTRDNFRPELQALRALAVGAVVLNHSWPGLAPGGYVGVDVFFVVSGFLITRQLLREREDTGRIRLIGFYLRRARRLLPAAAIVLLTVVVMTFLFVPWREWQENFTEIAASALYVQNWAIVAVSESTTAVRHFWSLSVEEQFYLVWPLLLLAAIGVASVLRRSRAVVLVAVVGAIGVASLAWSIVTTGSDYQLAYFSTFSRAWEFAAGALVAIIPVAVPGRWRDALLWLGLATIVGSMLGIRDAEAFPGALALIPVVGTLAVIVASHAGVPRSAQALVGWRPVQWVGDNSYALYLWHWPVLVFAPLVTGVASPSWFMVILIGFSVVLAGVTTRFVERPVRRIPVTGDHLRARRRLVSAGVTVGMLLAVGLSTAGAAYDSERKTTTVACEKGAQSSVG